jgi:hypothetical protein
MMKMFYNINFINQYCDNDYFLKYFFVYKYIKKIFFKKIFLKLTHQNNQNIYKKNIKNHFFPNNIWNSFLNTTLMDYILYY